MSTIVIVSTMLTVLWTSSLHGGREATRRAWFNLNWALCVQDGQYREIEVEYKMAHGDIGVMFVCLSKEKEKKNT